MGIMKTVERGGTALAVIALAACSSGNGGEATGTLSVALTDAPVDGVEKIVLEFDGVTLRRAGGPPIHIPFDAPVVVDLLTLTDGNSVDLLHNHELPAGTYLQLALNVNAAHDGVYDSYVVTYDGGQHELFVPSGAQTGLKLIGGFTITADQHTSFLVDWDARMGLVNPPGLPGYTLRPTLRVIDLTEYGFVTGTVAEYFIIGDCDNDLNLDVGNAVYVYEGSVEEPGNIGSQTLPNPVATAAVTQGASGLFGYEVMLSPGEYTVAFTCQAGGDVPEEDTPIEFVQPTTLTLEDGDTVIVDFQ